MSKFRVEILGNVTCKGNITVDAESEEEAKDIAEELMWGDDIDWFSDPGPPDDFEIYAEALEKTDDDEFFKKDDE